MDTLIKDINDIVITEANAINHKIQGLNFLEILKFSLLEKIVPLLKDNKSLAKITSNLSEEFKSDNRFINILINYYKQPFSFSKKIIQEDSLFISFNETSNIDIYEDNKNFTSVVIYKNTGISLPKETLINSKFNQNVLILEVRNKNTEQGLTNKEII